MKSFITTVLLAGSLLQPASLQSNQDTQALKASAAAILCALPLLPIIAGVHDQTNPEAWSKTALTIYFVATTFLAGLGLSAMYGDLSAFFALLPKHSHTTVVVHDDPWYHRWFYSRPTVVVTSY